MSERGSSPLNSKKIWLVSSLSALTLVGGASGAAASPDHDDRSSDDVRKSAFYARGADSQDRDDREHHLEGGHIRGLALEHLKTELTDEDRTEGLKLGHRIGLGHLKSHGLGHLNHDHGHLDDGPLAEDARLATEDPEAEKPTDEAPADEPESDEPVEQPADETAPPVDEAPAEEPADGNTDNNQGDEPTGEVPDSEDTEGDEPAEEPADEEPLTEVTPPVDEAPMDSPVAVEPPVEEPVIEAPVAEDPVADAPVLEAPSASDPAAVPNPGATDSVDVNVEVTVNR